MNPCAHWSGASAGRIELRFKGSKALSMAVPALHILLAASLLALPGWWLKGVALMMLGMSLYACGTLPGNLWSRRAMVSASLHEDGSWTLAERSGRVYQARLKGGHVAGRLLVITNWQTGRGERLAILLPGVITGYELGRLRAHLTMRNDP